jgi:glycosyltransferase involved in cell wall biosynthesis
MQRAINELTAGERFDVIQVESSQMSGFDFPSGPTLVLDEHNVEHDLMRRVASVESSWLRRFYQGMEQRKVRDEEIAAWRLVDGCTVTSVQDERTVHEAAPATPTRVITNGVDLEHFAPIPGTVTPDSIVFVGSINYRPNTDAVLHFATRILPLVRLARALRQPSGASRGRESASSGAFPTSGPTSPTPRWWWSRSGWAAAPDSRCWRGSPWARLW